VDVQTHIHFFVVSYSLAMVQPRSIAKKSKPSVPHS